MLHPGLLPICGGILVALVAGFLQSHVWRVPNSLTLKSIGLAWICGLVLTVLGGPGAGLLSSIAGALLAGAVLLPLYVCGGLGAGCVKAQMSFGAWIGCGLELSQVPRVVLLSTLAGVVLAMALYLIARLRPRAEDDPLSGEFNAQLPLSLGSIAGLLACWGFGLM